MMKAFRWCLPTHFQLSERYAYLYWTWLKTRSVLTSPVGY